MTANEFKEISKILDNHKHPIYLSNGLPVLCIPNSEVDKVKNEIKRLVK